MKLKLIFTLVVCFLTASTAFSQTEKTSPKLPSAKEIIAKYVKAIGGREAHEKVKSALTKGTVEISPMGIKGTFETISAAPNRSLTRMNLAGLGEFLEGFDGKAAWSLNPVQGVRDKTGLELLQTKLLNDFYREINLEKLYPKMEVTGIEKIGQKDAYVVRAEPEGLPASVFYFDLASGLLVRSDTTVISPEGRQPVKGFIEETKLFDGVMLPSKLRTVLPTVEILMSVTEVKTNVPVDDSKFTRPKI